jgi:hypothetical protein
MCSFIIKWESFVKVKNREKNDMDIHHIALDNSQVTGKIYNNNNNNFRT